MTSVTLTTFQVMPKSTNFVAKNQPGVERFERRVSASGVYYRESKQTEAWKQSYWLHPHPMIQRRKRRQGEKNEHHP